MSMMKRIGRPLLRLMKPDAVSFDGSVIPARHLRFGGQNFRDDAAFVQTGEREAQRLTSECGLVSGGSILEIGCGTGRLPIGILRTMGDVVHYHGIDVSDAAIDWCRRRIERAHPLFRFTHIDVRNERYNPRGGQSVSAFTVPATDRSADVIYLYSVFSHLELEDMQAYLREFERILKPDGRLFFTTFAEENVPDFAVNPSDYKREWKGALHCVRFNTTYLKNLLHENGFSVEWFDYGNETDGQSAVYCIRSNDGKAR